MAVVGSVGRRSTLLERSTAPIVVRLASVAVLGVVVWIGQGTARTQAQPETPSTLLAADECAMSAPPGLPLECIWLEGHPSDVAIDADGNVLVAGSTHAAPGSKHLERSCPSGWFAVMLESDGESRWSRRGCDGSATAVAFGPSGESYVLVAEHGDPEETEVRSASRVLKLDANGDTVWSRRLLPPEDEYSSGHVSLEGLAVAVDSEGGVAVVGVVLAGSATHIFISDPFLHMLEASGETRWRRTLDSVVVGTINALVFDEEDLVIVGSANGYRDDDSAAGAFVAKIGRDGDQLWMDRFGASIDDHAADVAHDGSGRVVVIGAAHGVIDDEDGPGYGAYARAQATDGEELWMRAVGADRWDLARGVAIVAEGEVLVVGTTADTGGARLWRLDAGGRIVDVMPLGSGRAGVADAIAANGTGDVAIVGASKEPGAPLHSARGFLIRTSVPR